MDDRRFRALLIGNWEYQDRDGELQPLKGPRNDVEVLRDALAHEEFGCVHADDLMVQRNLTSEKIATALYQFIKGAEPSDNLIIYYSGHGERLYHSRLALCGTEVAHSEVEAVAFDTERLKEWMELYNRSPSTVIILDCCYSGQYKGVVEDTLVASFGSGTAVLASGGNEPSLDSLADDSPSPFTQALVAHLTDPDLMGDRTGYLSVEDIYQALLKTTPPLVPKPRRTVAASGSLALARRPVEQADDESLTQASVLIGYRRDQRLETIDLHFTANTVTISGDEVAWELAQLDENRRAAIRRMTQLADAVMRSPDFVGGSPLAEAVRKAWDTVGANLFETAVPERLRERIAAELDDTGDTAIKLRLHFDDDEARELECYPWEFLQVGNQLGQPGDPPLPLGLREGLLIERAAPHGRTKTIGDRAVAEKATVGLLNCLPGPLARIGRQVSEELRDLSTVTMLFDLRQHDRHGSWGNLQDSLRAQRPHHLLLFAPVRRRRRTCEIGFTGTPYDWRPTSDVAKFLRNNVDLVSLTLVTFASPPSEDAVRGVFESARTLSEHVQGPVIFVCHAPGFEQALEGMADTGPESFPGRLIDALSRNEPLDRSMYYACDQVINRVPVQHRTQFGVPGYYAPEFVAGKRSGVTHGPAGAEKLATSPHTSRRSRGARP